MMVATHAPRASLSPPHLDAECASASEFTVFTRFISRVAPSPSRPESNQIRGGLKSLSEPLRLAHRESYQDHSQEPEAPDRQLFEEPSGSLAHRLCGRGFDVLRENGPIQRPQGFSADLQPQTGCPCGLTLFGHRSVSLPLELSGLSWSRHRHPHPVSVEAAGPNSPTLARAASKFACWPMRVLAPPS